MSTTSNDVLLQAYTHIKAHDPAPARALLGKYLRNNPNSERGWLLLSLAVDEPAQQRDCLQRVLLINPFNTEAQARLARLTTITPLTTNGDPAELPLELEAAPSPETVSLSEAATQPVPEPVAEVVPPVEPPSAITAPPIPPKPRLLSNWLIPVIVLVWAVIFVILLSIGAYFVFGGAATPTPAAPTAPIQTTPVVTMTPLRAPTLPPEWTAAP